MASFRVVLKPSAEKDLRSLPKPLAKRLWAKIEALSTEPLPRRSVKLAGAEDLYRVRQRGVSVVISTLSKPASGARSAPFIDVSQAKAHDGIHGAAASPPP